MLPKPNRLKKQKEFEYIFKNGKTIKGKYFFIRIVPSSQDYCRIGFIVSKKVAKSAVLRNKIKRRLRAAAREFRNILGSYDIIFIAYPNIKTASYQEIKKDLESIIAKNQYLVIN